MSFEKGHEVSLYYSMMIQSLVNRALPTLEKTQEMEVNLTLDDEGCDGISSSRLTSREIFTANMNIIDCWDRLQPTRDPTEGLSGRKWMDGWMDEYYNRKKLVAN